MKNTKDNEAVYMRRLARRSAQELLAMQKLVSERKGQMRYGAMMLRCLTAALCLKAGLQPA